MLPDSLTMNDGDVVVASVQQVVVELPKASDAGSQTDLGETGHV